MKKIILIPLFCIYGFLFSQNVKNDLIIYVEEHYSQILELIPLDRENLYGFENREMFKHCEVGTPIKLLRINFKNEMEITNEWRIPLLINGNTITLLTVIEDETQNFKIVDMGGNVLAKLIDKYNTHNEKIAYLLRDYRSETDYVAFEFVSRFEKNFYKIQKQDTSSEIQEPEVFSKGISLDEIIELDSFNE